MKNVAPKWISCVATMLALVVAPAALGRTKTKISPELRAQYLERVMQSATPAEIPITGSLWTDSGKLTYLAGDYKAARVNDTIIIQVVQQTTATASGGTDAQRAFDTTSGITALPGRIKVGGVNPLFAANSSTKLKGQGQISSASKLQTSLSGRVLAVLPNGNLVIEAEREVLLNHERETAMVRGVVRPGDVSPNNVVLSTSLADLEIELKGKGVVSDATRPPNVIMRTLQWLIGF